MQWFHFSLRWPDVISFCVSGYVLFFFFLIFIKSDLSSAAPEEEQNQKEKAGNKSEVQQCKLCVCMCSGAANQRFPTAGTKPAASSSCMTAPQWPPTPLLHLNSSSSSSSPRRSYSSPAVTVCPLSLSVSLVRDWIRTNPDFQTYITTNDLWGSNQTQQRMWSCDLDLTSELAETHRVWLNKSTWKYKLSSRK